MLYDSVELIAPATTSLGTVTNRTLLDRVEPLPVLQNQDGGRIKFFKSRFAILRSKSMPRWALPAQSPRPFTWPKGRSPSNS